MNRALWTQTLTEHFSPPWPCSWCRKGTFALVPGSLIQKETAWSKGARHEDDWDVEFIRYAFTAWVKCANPSCGDEAAVAGIGSAEIHYYGEDDVHYAENFAPRFCYPMPDIFELPKKCPDDVAHELRAAFKLFWSDSSATANRVRVALEGLMDYLGVQKRRKNKKGKLDKLTLHHRIEIFTKTEPEIGDQLMALKLLGNTGSHDGRVMRNDVLDAFEIIEYALLELIEHRSKRITALAQGLTVKHKPGPKKRTRNLPF